MLLLFVPASGWIRNKTPRLKVEKGAINSLRKTDVYKYHKLCPLTWVIVSVLQESRLDTTVCATRRLETRTLSLKCWRRHTRQSTGWYASTRWRIWQTVATSCSYIITETFSNAAVVAADKCRWSVPVLPFLMTSRPAAAFVSVVGCPSVACGLASVLYPVTYYCNHHCHQCYNLVSLPICSFFTAGMLADSWLIEIVAICEYSIS